MQQLLFERLTKQNARQHLQIGKEPSWLVYHISQTSPDDITYAETAQALARNLFNSIQSGYVNVNYAGL